MGESDRKESIQNSSRDLKSAFDVATERIRNKDLCSWSGLTPQTFYRYRQGKDVKFSTFQDLINGLPPEEYKQFLSVLLQGTSLERENPRTASLSPKTNQEIIALVSIFVSQCNIGELGELFAAISAALLQNPKNPISPETLEES